MTSSVMDPDPDRYAPVWGLHHTKPRSHILIFILLAVSLQPFESDFNTFKLDTLSSLPSSQSPSSSLVSKFLVLVATAPAITLKSLWGGPLLLPAKADIVIGIDLSEEYCKVVYVLRNSFETLLDSQSGRHHSTMVAFDQIADEPEMAIKWEAGANALSGWPSQQSFRETNRFVGTLFDKIQETASFKVPEFFIPYDIHKDEDRGTVELVIGPNQKLNMETLKSFYFLYLQNLVRQTTSFALGKIYAVISVPCSATQRYIRATVQACELSGMPVLTLTRTITAAAIWYARDLSIRLVKDPKNTPPAKTVMFVDYGSTKVDMGVVRVDFSSDSKLHNHGVISTLSCESVYGIGGKDIDFVIAKKFIDYMEETTKQPFVLRPRARNNLLSMVRKCKETSLRGDQHLCSINSEELNPNFTPSQVYWVTESILDAALEELNVKQKLRQAMVDATAVAQPEDVQVVGNAYRLRPIVSWLNEGVREVSLVPSSSSDPSSGVDTPQKQPSATEGDADRNGDANNSVAVTEGNAFKTELPFDETISGGSIVLACLYSSIFKLSFTLVWNQFVPYNYSVVSCPLTEEPLSERAILYRRGKQSKPRRIDLRPLVDTKVQLIEDDTILATYEIVGISDLLKLHVDTDKQLKVSLDFRFSQNNILELSATKAVLIPTDNQTSSSSTTTPTPSISTEDADAAIFDEGYEYTDDYNENCMLRKRKIPLLRADVCNRQKFQNATLTTTTTPDPVVDVTSSLSVRTVYGLPKPMSDDQFEEAQKLLKRIDESSVAERMRVDLMNHYEAYIYRIGSLLKDEAFTKMCNLERHKEIEEMHEKEYKFVDDEWEIFSGQRLSEMKKNLEEFEKIVNNSPNRFEEVVKFTESVEDMLTVKFVKALKKCHQIPDTIKENIEHAEKLLNETVEFWKTNKEFDVCVSEEEYSKKMNECKENIRLLTHAVERAGKIKKTVTTTPKPEEGVESKDGGSLPKVEWKSHGKKQEEATTNDGVVDSDGHTEYAENINATDDKADVLAENVDNPSSAVHTPESSGIMDETDHEGKTKVEL